MLINVQPGSEMEVKLGAAIGMDDYGEEKELLSQFGIVDSSLLTICAGALDCYDMSFTPEGIGMSKLP